MKRKFSGELKEKKKPKKKILADIVTSKKNAGSFRRETK
jgi:hypothetical protein